MKAYKSLVNRAIELGSEVSVWDGEEWQVSRSSDAPEIFGAIESVAESNLNFFCDQRTGQPILVGWALILSLGVDDHETVSDYTDNTWINAWFDAYQDAYDKENPNG